MTIEANKELARRFFDMYGGGEDLELIAELFAPEATIDFPGMGEIDVEAFKGVGAMFREGFAPASMSVDYQIAEGDTVVTGATFRGTHSNMFMDIPATGRPVELTSITIDTMRDGKIVHRLVMFDTMDMTRQLGV